MSFTCLLYTSIGQAQIAFFPDAGVEHGLKRIEGGAEMLPEAAPAPFVVGQPLGIGRSAEAVSVAVAHEGLSLIHIYTPGSGF